MADQLAAFDCESPVHKSFKPGIGPFGEPQLIKTLATRLSGIGYTAKTRRTPDLEIGKRFAIECKIVRPFGDNGREAENWSVNLLHPYPGNVSLIGDAFKLVALTEYEHRLLCAICFEHETAVIPVEPLLASFEAILSNVLKVRVSQRHLEVRRGLVHPTHQVLKCAVWAVMPGPITTARSVT
jgi:hypothetical protein